MANPKVDTNSLNQLIQFAQSHGLTITSGEGFSGGRPVVPNVGHSAHSLHYIGRAVDVGMPDSDSQSSILSDAKKQGMTVIPEQYTGEGPEGYSTGPHWHIQFTQPPRGVNTSGLNGIQQMVINAANKYSIPPEKLLALVQTESNFDPKAINPKSGAAGLGQFIPSTAKSRGLSNPLDPQSNIDATAAYIKDLHDKTGDWSSALSYYGGYGGDTDKARIYIGRNARFEQQWASKLGTSPAEPISASVALKDKLLGEGPIFPQEAFSLSGNSGLENPKNQQAAQSSNQSPDISLQQRLLGTGGVFPQQSFRSS